MTEEAFVVRYRVKSKSAKNWGAWAVVSYTPPTGEHAVRYVERQRAKDYVDHRSEIEWQALRLTTEVLA